MANIARPQELGRDPSLTTTPMRLPRSRPRALQVVPQRQVPRRGVVIDGRYRVLDRLGAGAMGVVLLARDEGLDRRVALKIMKPELAHSRYVELFEREARMMARVTHTNVIRVYALGKHEELPYFAMELGSRNLDEWVRTQARRPVDAALRIVREICEGVAAIHESGSVHRDLKPSNILLSAANRPKVADFGLALPRDTAAKELRELVGTPGYIAPELALGNADTSLMHRADVYSLGCLAYELLTGRPPFSAVGSLASIIQNSANAVVPPSKLRSDVGSSVDAAIMHALARNPRERTSCVRALRRELEDCEGS